MGDNYPYRADNVVLGGTRHTGEYDVSTEGPWYQDILQRCDSQLLPGIKVFADCPLLVKEVQPKQNQKLSLDIARSVDRF